MSRGRLCRAQAWRRVPRSPSAEAEPGDTTSAACGTGGPRRCRVSAREGADKPASETLDARLGQAREGRLRRTDLWPFTGPGRVRDPTPSGTPPPSKARRPPSAAPKLRKNPGAAGSMESPRGTPTARIGAPLPRRERAAIRVERTGGAQAYRTLRTGNGRPAETGPPSPPPDRDPREGTAVLQSAASHGRSDPGRSPRGRPRSPTFRRFRVASKRCSNS